MRTWETITAPSGMTCDEIRAEDDSFRMIYAETAVGSQTGIVLPKADKQFIVIGDYRKELEEAFEEGLDSVMKVIHEHKDSLSPASDEID